MNLNSKNRRFKCYSRLLPAIRTVFTGVLCAAIMSIPLHAGSRGSLDKQFGIDGIVLTGANLLADVELQTDGKILVAGGAVLERYLSDGSADTTFGNQGTAVLATGKATAIALLADGKIIVAVDTSNIGVGQGSDFVLLGYNADGSLDTGFGNNGSVITPVGADYSNINDLAVQEDGTIVAAGKTYEIFYDGYSYSIRALTFALARYNSDGTLDSTFGSNGIAITDIAAGLSDEANAVTLQADGKIIAAGYAHGVNNGLDFALARYNTDGSLDSTFGFAGIVTTHLNSGSERARDVAVQADGKIVAAGFAGTGTGTDFALVRYNTDGSLDTAFGNNGLVTTDFDNNSDFAHAVGIQADGKIVAAGNASVLIHSTQTRYFVIGLARYNTNGDLDATFGKKGKVETQVGNGTTFASDLAIQDDGKIVVAGTALLRYNN
jgi:uncharacterized delta-60 repeat protein